MMQFDELEVGMELEAQTFLGEWHPARIAKLERAGTVDVAWISWAKVSLGGIVEAQEMKGLDELRPIGGGAP